MFGRCSDRFSGHVWEAMRKFGGMLSEHVWGMYNRFGELCWKASLNVMKGLDWKPFGMLYKTDESYLTSPSFYGIYEPMKPPDKK